jgi:hypothetical protein
MNDDAEAYLAGKLAPAVELFAVAEVEHPTLRQGFATTSKVFTNRFKITPAEQLDDQIQAWLAEAREAVGPGTR